MRLYVHYIVGQRGEEQERFTLALDVGEDVVNGLNLNQLKKLWFVKISQKIGMYQSKVDFTISFENEYKILSEIYVSDSRFDYL